MHGLDRVIACLGDPGFGEALLGSVNTAARVDHCALIRFDGARTARLVASASRPGLRVPQAVQEEYIDHFQRLDPNRRLFGRAAPGQALVSRMMRERVPAAEYRLRCYDRPGLVDRFSVIAESQGDWYCLNLFSPARKRPPSLSPRRPPWRRRRRCSPRWRCATTASSTPACCLHRRDASKASRRAWGSSMSA